MSNTGTIEALGGEQVGKGGAGGAGTVTYTQISGLLTAPQQPVVTEPQIPDDIINSEVVGEMTRQVLLPGPVIKLDSVEETTTKNITIETLDDSKIEYSIDLGETWIEYTGPIELKENTFILTRTKDSNGNIIATSTMTVTTIKKEETLEEKETLPEDPSVIDNIDMENVIVPEDVVEEGDTNE